MYYCFLFSLQPTEGSKNGEASGRRESESPKPVVRNCRQCMREWQRREGRKGWVYIDEEAVGLVGVADEK